MITKRWCLRCETGIIRQGAFRADGIDIASMCRACSMTYHEMRWSLQPDPFAWEHMRSEWGGREDEANAYHTLMPEGLYLVTNRVDQLVVEGRLATMRERIKVEEDAFTDNALAQVRIYLGDAWRDANRDGPAMEYGAAADAHIGHTSREIPAWNEEQPMTESRIRCILEREGAGYGAGLARLLMTPEQAAAWDDNDGRILFDTVTTRGAVAARWVNEPGATLRQPDDEE